MAKKPVMLMILDGFGIAPKSEGNAVALANKQNYKQVEWLLVFQKVKWEIQKLVT